MDSRPVLEAKEFVRNMGGSSRAFSVRTSDGSVWVLKGRRPWVNPDLRIHRTLFNDQTVARIGLALGAPVPSSALVRVTDAFIAAHATVLTDHQHGIFHGSAMIDGTVSRFRVWPEPSVLANRPRFALMAVLFGWVLGVDHHETVQDDKNLVWSIDHDLCMGGRRWMADDFLRGEPAGLDEWSFTMGGQPSPHPTLELHDLRGAMSALRRIQPATVAAAVAASPDEWEIERHERILAAKFLWDRRCQLLAKEDSGQILDGMKKIQYVT